jgi:hypothetical protein
MSSIRTYNDLLEEKKRLEASLVVQNGIIRRDFIELREEIRPALDLLSIIGRMINRDRSNPVIAMGVNLVAGVLLRNAVLSGSSKITRLIVPFLANKVSTLFRNKNGGTVFQKLAEIWNKNISNGHPAGK